MEEHGTFSTKLHLSIHNYADSGVIHNLLLSHFSAVSAYARKYFDRMWRVSFKKPQLQFQWKKLQNVALVAGFNLHPFSSLNSQKREFMAILVEYTCSNKIAIFESTMKRTSAVHTYLNCTYSHGGYKLCALDCAWRFKIYVPRLAEAWRQRDNPPCEL